MNEPSPAAAAYWQGRREVRADLRTSARLIGILALVGVPAGLAWWALAPRADFRITGDGPEQIGSPSNELFIADDAVFTLLLAVVGLVAGTAVWWLRRRRGVATVVALAVGAVACAVVAWQVGELLGTGPTEEQLQEVGARVTTSLTLGSPAALAVPSFMAVLAYVLAALATHDDALGRSEPAAHDEEREPGTGLSESGSERALVDVPPPGWPAA